jgi:hypothetical protein
VAVERLEKFIDRVAYRVEASLQSNELINVFQDDFTDMLGGAKGDDKGQSLSDQAIMPPRTFFDHGYCKNKRVSSIKFHPKKQFLIGMSLIENLSFDDRAQVCGKSFDSHVLIMNFSDSHIITLNYVLETSVEVSCIEFHKENPNIVIGGTTNG